MSQREQIRELKKELKKMNDIKAENVCLKTRIKTLYDEYQKVVPELQKEVKQLRWTVESLEKRKDPFDKILKDLELMGINKKVLDVF